MPYKKLTAERVDTEHDDDGDDEHDHEHEDEEEASVHYHDTHDDHPHADDAIHFHCDSVYENGNSMVGHLWLSALRFLTPK
jgi:hypothetical protein